MPFDPQHLLRRAAEAKRESKYVEFKDHFDPQLLSEWCEILKDIVALANSGGGVLVIGVQNNGALSGQDVTPVLALDAAKVSDQVHKYTSKHFSGCEIQSVSRDSQEIAAIVVSGTDVPLVFTKAGTYTVEGDGKKPKHKSAFREGVVYVRHGAKSEPATSDDLDEMISRRLDQIRETWLGGIKQVIAAPRSAEVMLVSTLEHDVEGTPTKFRLTTDPTAPVYGRVDPDESHPYRQTEVVREVNQRIGAANPVNPHDVLAVRRVYGIEPASRPEFSHKPKFGSPQYSDAFIEWIVQEYERDPEFFVKARIEYRKRQK